MKPYTNKRFYFRRTARHVAIACILSVTGFAFFLPSTAFAAESERVLSPEVAIIVNKTIAHGNFQLSLDLLLPLSERTDLRPYERATIYQMIGEYQYGLDRPVLAQEAFEQALVSGGLLPHEAKNIELVIAQLMIVNRQYRKGAERLEVFVKGDDAPKAQHVELLVNAWMQAEAFDRALPWAEIWYKSANPKERRHYDLMNFLFNMLDMPQRQEDIVKEMIENRPDDKGLWDAWASISASQGRDQEAFEIIKITYSRGLIKSEQEILKVIRYYTFYDMPYQAAEILEHEMAIGRVTKTPERLKQLGSLFLQARDDARAKPILEAALREEIAQLKDSERYADLAEKLVSVGSCEDSETAFKAAIEQGYDPGKAWSLIGNCHYDQTQDMDRLSCDMTPAQMSAAPISKARNGVAAAFSKVPQSSREYKNAQKWVQFIEAEKESALRKCDFGYDRSDEFCYQKIKLAYDATIFTDGFKLDDESCQKYVADYDAIFRPSYSEK